MHEECSRRQQGESAGGSATSWMRAALTLAAAGVVAVGTLMSIEDPLRARGLLVAGLYLTLALSEIVAPFVPTLFLLVATPLVLGPMSNRYALGSVLSWGADPVLATALLKTAMPLALANPSMNIVFDRS